MPTDRKTTRFRKMVLAPGKYPTGKSLNGNQKYEVFDDKRLKEIAENGNKFLQTGARIPVPFAHVDDNGKLVSPVNISDQGSLIDAFSGQPIGWRADLNAGYTTNFEYGSITDPETGKTETGLLCEVEIDGDQDTPESAAHKFGRTVREVSIGLHRNREDPFGNKYNELPIHVAAVTNPISTVQTNFVPVEAKLFSDVLLFNTNAPMGDKDPSADNGPEEQEKPNNPAIPEDPQSSEGPNQQVANVVEGLRACGIDLPEDTNMENFWERATIAIRQKIASESANKAEEDNGESLTKTPEGKTPSGAPIAMSATPNPTSETPEADSKTAVLLGNYLNMQKESLKTRIEKLVKKGLMTAKYAKETLTPQIETLMSSATLESIDEQGNLTEASQIEGVISALESMSGEDLTEPGNRDQEPSGYELSQPSDEDAGYLGFRDEQYTGEASAEETEDLLALSESFPPVG